MHPTRLLLLPSTRILTNAFKIYNMIKAFIKRSISSKATAELSVDHPWFGTIKIYFVPYSAYGNIVCLYGV